MFNLEINNDLNDLKKYMLYSTFNVTDKKSDLPDCLSNNTNNTDEKTNGVEKISKFLTNPNYNKFKSKYYETDNYRHNYDKLFWCYYKIINNYEDEDLKNLNLFTTEKDIKFKIIDSIKNYKTILKTNKFKINKLIDDLTNSKNISLETFSALCYCSNLSILLFRDNNTFSIINKKTSGNFNAFLKFEYNNTSTISNNYKIYQTDLSNSEIDKILKEFFYIENIEKPLRSISHYKSDDLIKICNILKINIYNENSKKKTKLMLYSDIIKILS